MTSVVSKDRRKERLTTRGHRELLEVIGIFYLLCSGDYTTVYV